jgi:hypothetical protein
VNEGDFIMSYWSDRIALTLIAVSMIVAPLTGWSVFAQAAILGAALILAAIIHRRAWPAIILSIFYVACTFVLALIVSGSGSKVLPVWLYGGLATAYWLQIHGNRCRMCC